MLYMYFDLNHGIAQMDQAHLQVFVAFSSKIFFQNIGEQVFVTAVSAAEMSNIRISVIELKTICIIYK